MNATERMILRVADALVKAVDEHGAPNTFSFGELVGAYNAMFAGRAVRAQWEEFKSTVASRRPNLRVVLEEGRLCVEEVSA